MLFKKITFYLLLFTILNCIDASGQKTATQFVKVKGNHFQIGNNPYHFLGANFWYGMNLGSTGTGGDRARLLRELDALQKLGIDNLRILALTEGPDTEPYRIVPSVQPKPGVFNEELLKGLDYLLVEMGKRKMYAVVCLGDFWHWSGGFGQYMVWAGDEKTIPYPPPHENGSWDTYQKWASQFYSKPKAVQLYWNAINKVVTRTNTITKKAYKEDPYIMSWQLGNEPRGLNNQTDFNIWIDSTAGLIKSLDPNHLVNVGSEGYTPYKGYAGNDPIKNQDGKNIDYTTAHVWVENWEWYNPKKHDETFPRTLDSMRAYVKEHVEVASKLGKPLVFEEFGIARDNGSFEPNSTVKNKDDYYGKFFQEIYQYAQDNKSPVAGVNFWAWAGEGRPRKPEAFWKPGDQFIGDPPHESQGWYSVYNTDTTTFKVIKNYATKMKTIK